MYPMRLGCAHPFWTERCCSVITQLNAMKLFDPMLKPSVHLAYIVGDSKFYNPLLIMIPSCLQLLKKKCIENKCATFDLLSMKV